MDAHAWLAWFAVALNLAITAAYVFGVLGQWRAGKFWSLWRLTFWLAGSGLLAAAFAPSVMSLAHVDLRWHMGQHLVIGMLAPLVLVLAAPATLLLRTLPTARARWVSGLLRSRYLQVVAHPLSALLLNVGGMYLLYLTPLYAASLESNALHALVHIHFFLAGYLFCWAILAGPDPSANVSGFGTRLGVLFLAMASHAILGKLMYGQLLPRGTLHTAEQIRSAAQLMYYVGDLAEVLLLIALLSFWLFASERRVRPDQATTRQTPRT